MYFLSYSDNKDNTKLIAIKPPNLTKYKKEKPKILNIFDKKIY